MGKKPAKRRAVLTDGTFDDKLAGAFARNGMNTILLDLKEDTSAVRVKVEHIEGEQQEAKSSRNSLHEKLDTFGRDLQGLKQTVDDIAPKVIVLHDERTQRIGQRNMIKAILGVVTKGRAAVLALSGSALAVWHQWPVIKLSLWATVIVAIPLLLVAAASAGLI